MSSSSITPEKPVSGSLVHRIGKLWHSDLAYDLRHDPVAAVASIVAMLLIGAALLAPLIAPFNPFDLRQINLLDSLLPPAWVSGGQAQYLLGTDDQGRDLLSTILFGLRLSLVVALASVFLSLVIGIAIGLTAGLLRGPFDAIVMRIADVQLSFPALLIALLADGVARAALPHEIVAEMSLVVIICSIALAGWVQYARTIRGMTLIECDKDYVQAARLSGVSNFRIALKHVLPNVVGPALVLATVQIATAIVTESTLSYLGVGVPPTEPSLGTLVRIGNDYLFSGSWWVAVFPGLTLVAIVFSTNLLGDWLREATNPRLS